MEVHPCTSSAAGGFDTCDGLHDAQQRNTFKAAERGQIIIAAHDDIDASRDSGLEPMVGTATACRALAQTRSSGVRTLPRQGLSALLVVATIAVVLVFHGARGQGYLPAVAGPTAVGDMANGVSVDGVTRSALAACLGAHPHDNACEDLVPGLRDCMQARLQCHAAAARPRATVGDPKPFGEGDAIVAARGAAPAGATAPVFAQEMTYGEYVSRYESGAGNSMTPAELQVWVVTVHAPRQTDGAPGVASKTFGVYTVVYNARTRDLISECIGCAFLG